MKNKRLPENLIIIFLSVAVISILAFTALHNNRINFNSGGENSRISSKSSSGSKTIYGEKHGQYEKTVTQLEPQSNAIQFSRKISGKNNETGSPQKPERKYPINLIAEKNLEGNAKAERKNYKFYYVPFLEKLGVSPENIHELTELYSNRAIEREKIYKNYYDKYGKELDQSTNWELSDELELFNKNYDKRIHDLAGEDNIEQYDLFDKSIVNREMVLGFNNQLDSNKKLNEDKTEELILSLYDIDTDFYPSNNSMYDSSKTGKPYPYLEIMKSRKKEYLIEAKRILSDSQYDKFIEYLEARDVNIDLFLGDDDE